jgi:hypothetical protein
LIFHHRTQKVEELRKKMEETIRKNLGIESEIELGERGG